MSYSSSASSSGITTSKTIEQINFFAPLFVSLFLFTALSATYVWVIRTLKNYPEGPFWIEQFKDVVKWSALGLCIAFYAIVLISSVQWDKVFAPLTMLHCFFVGSAFLGFYFFTTNELGELTDDELKKMSIYLSIGTALALVVMMAVLTHKGTSSSSSSSSHSSSSSSSHTSSSSYSVRPSSSSHHSSGQPQSILRSTPRVTFQQNS